MYIRSLFISKCAKHLHPKFVKIFSTKDFKEGKEIDTDTRTERETEKQIDREKGRKKER